jgi:hypothetical protein
MPNSGTRTRKAGQEIEEVDSYTVARAAHLHVRLEARGAQHKPVEEMVRHPRLASVWRHNFVAALES